MILVATTTQQHHIHMQYAQGQTHIIPPCVAGLLEGHCHRQIFHCHTNVKIPTMLSHICLQGHFAVVCNSTHSKHIQHHTTPHSGITHKHSGITHKQHAQMANKSTTSLHCQPLHKEPQLLEGLTIKCLKTYPNTAP
jgi:hypothetical protein